MTGQFISYFKKFECPVGVANLKLCLLESCFMKCLYSSAVCHVCYSCYSVLLTLFFFLIMQGAPTRPAFGRGAGGFGAGPASSNLS